MQKKILTTFLILFFTVIIFNINSVFGVGIVSQSWTEDIDGDGKLDLVFRTYTGPYSGMVASYHKLAQTSSDVVEGGAWSYTYAGKSYTSKWIYTYDKINVQKASENTFKSIGFSLHKEPLSAYSQGKQIGYTYNSSPLSHEMSTLVEVINNAKTIYATPIVNAKYDNSVFYEVMRTSGTYQDIYYGTGLSISGLYAVGQTEYRYTIIRLKEGNVIADVCVTDNVIYNSDVVNILEKAKVNELTKGCYISNILISKQYGISSYEVSRTATDFVKQYGKTWAYATLGLEDKSFESAINLYDNELIFPQLSKRTVLVRHINVGNNTTISRSIVNNGTRIPSTNLSLLVGNPEKTVWGTKTSINGYYGYEEYYEDLIDVEQSITKAALASTNYYKCIGYNIGVANTEQGALANVQSRIDNYQYTSGTQAYIPSKSVQTESDYVVIDFYYSTYDNDVSVNHLYVDQYGNVLEMNKQTIKPNDNAVINSQTINRINKDVYVSEIYKKQLGYNIRTGIANSLKTEIEKNQVQYKGYEVFNKKINVSELVGTKRTNLNQSQTVTLTSNNIQVNYYYYTNNQEEVQEPAKTIGGSVFVSPTGTNAIYGKCNDTDDSILITSVPSGSNVKVGIKDIPLYMIGAITTEYVSPEKETHTFDLTLNLRMGNIVRTITYKDINYKVGYYKVTNMAVYKLVNAYVYDANKGYERTVGNSLFDWENGSLRVIEQSNQSISVMLTGINNKTIKNTLTEINNINNYVAINIQDKYGNYSTNVSNTSQYVMNIDLTEKLSEKQYTNLTNNSINGISQALGLKINISVQNMIVKVNDTTISSANKISYTMGLADYISRPKVPEATTKVQGVGEYIKSKEIYSRLGNYLKESDYTNNNKINSSVLNGVRVLGGKVNYQADVVIGSNKVTDIKDNVYYSNETNTDKKLVFRLKNTTISKTYGLNISNNATTSEEKYNESEPINIYTPITVTATIETDTNQTIDQTKNTMANISFIQINTPFTIHLANNEKPNIYNINNTNKYSAGYYVKFAFDVHKVSINGKEYNKGNRIPAGTWIGIIYKNKQGKAYITAQAYGNLDEDVIDIISEENSSYTVRAVAYNVTSSMLNSSTKYSIIANMIQETSDLKDILNNICKNPSYFAEKEYGVSIINRAYDFKVTDVKDISWKTVFRKSTGNSTNAHTGNLYFSGTTKWNFKSDKSNSIISRPTSEIGRNPLRILPIGPYKSTETTYIKAPKLGYRFSFDMKVTGSYYGSNGKAREDKKVAITTKFYYISKDGKTYLEESNGQKEGIYLFYKTSNGKYVRIDETGGGYNLIFTPNDGYRYIQDNDLSTLSTKSLSLGNLRYLTLTKDMATVSNGGTSITYYGEYKLPNSTIAVKVNSDGSYDINSPLKDGYIGVVFDIVVYSGKVSIGNLNQNVLLSYSKNTKVNQPNTSQWDYEGFLGYTGYGSKVKAGTLSMKLEKGNWNITDDIYNSIKGSVMLYDLDERAATDYE